MTQPVTPRHVSAFWLAVFLGVSIWIFQLENSPGWLTLAGYLTSFLAFGALLELFKSRDPSVASAQGKPSQALLDVAAIPERVMDIVGEYGGVLEDLTADRGGSILFPESALPRPREEIKQALEAALQVAKDGKIRAVFETGLDSLQDFIPADEIPSDPWERVKEWFRRTKWDQRSADRKKLVIKGLTALLIAEYGDQAEKKLDDFLARHRK